MNMFERFQTRRVAARAARLGIHVGDELAAAQRGERPKFDAAKNPKHARLAFEAADDIRIRELARDLRIVEEEAANGPTLLGSAVLALAILPIEVVGATQLVAMMDIESRHRLAIGTGLTIALVGVTAVLATTDASTAKNAIDVAKRTVRSTFVAIVYTLLVLAIALLRALYSLDEDVGVLQRVAEGLILLATAVGPAWALEWLVRRAHTAWSTWSRLRLLRRRVRVAKRTQERATSEVNAIHERGSKWDAERAHSHGLYGLTHALETAERAARKHRDDEDQTP